MEDNGAEVVQAVEALNIEVDKGTPAGTQPSWTGSLWC